MPQKNWIHFGKPKLTFFFRRMNLQAGEMINEKLSTDQGIVRLLWGRIPWYKHIFEVTSCYSGFQPKKHDGSPGKPRETTGFAKNVTQFYISGTESWCSRSSKWAFKAPARKSRLANLFENGGFSPTWTIAEIRHLTTGTKERQRLHWNVSQKDTLDNPPPHSPTPFIATLSLKI